MPGVSTLITVTSYQNQSSAEYTAGHLQGRPPSRLLRLSPHDICVISALPHGGALTPNPNVEQAHGFRQVGEKR